MVKLLDKVKHWIYTRGMNATYRDISPEKLKETREDRDDEIRRLYWGTRNFPRDKRQTVEKLAEDYGITKQRVSQIINAKPPPENDGVAK